MRRRGPGDGVVPVELLDGEDALTLPPCPDDDAAGPDPARARRLRWVGLAVVTVLLGTIVTATVIDGRRDAARRAAFAELGWVIPAFEGPLEEVWRSSGGWVIAETDGVLVVGDATSSTVRALEASSGAVLWERDDGPDDCTPVYDYRSADQSRYPAAEALVCAPSSPWAQGLPPEPGDTVSLVAVEVATEADLRTLVIDGSLLAQDSVGDDLLVTCLGADAAIGVIRWDLRAGEVWSYRSEPGLLPDDWSWAFLSRYELGEDTLLLTDDLALDLATGREVPAVVTDPEPSSDVYVQVLADGGQVEWPRGNDERGSFARGQVMNADGSVRFELDVRPWPLPTTDGSVPEAIMTLGADGAAVALDPLSGDELWSVPGMGYSRPAFLLDGVIVAVDPAAVTAIDARTGTVLWQVDTLWGDNSMMPTDGDVVLVQVAEPPGSAILAVNLRTGTEAWRMPGTGSASYWELMHVGGRFLILTETEIIGYR